jgi:hypothetical protein
MSLDDYILVGPVAYQGKPGCKNSRCTRGYRPGYDGCMGWHCSYCDEPCSSQGHKCDASEAILGESERIAKEVIEND